MSEQELIAPPEQCPSDSKLQGLARNCEGCPGQTMCRSLGQDWEEENTLIVRMKAIKHKILVMSGKGGVGKSSLAAQIAIGLSKEGKTVSVLDVDICGPSIPRLLNVEGKEIVNTAYGWIPVSMEEHPIGVVSVGSLLSEKDTPVVWRGPRKTNMIKRLLKDTYWGKLDYLIIDTPPGTSDEHLSVIKALQHAQLHLDGAILVTTPQQVAVTMVQRELTFCKKMGLNVLGVVENMSGYVCPCCDEETPLFPAVTPQYSVPLLARIPLDPRVTGLLDSGGCPFCQCPSSPTVRAITQLVHSILQPPNPSNPITGSNPSIHSNPLPT